MATSIVTVTGFGPDNNASIDSRTIDYFFQLGVGAGSYVTGGLPLSFSGLVHAPGLPLEARIFSFQSPNTGYTYRYNPDLGSSGTFQPYLLALGSAANYSVLGGASVTFASTTVITGGNVGSNPTNTVTGSPTFTDSSAVVTATAADHTSVVNAVAYFQGLAATSSGNSTLSGTYGPGVYVASSSMGISGNVTLSGAGTYVFVAGTTINLASGISVTLTNGATADNVYWVAGSSFSQSGTGSSISGTIISAVTTSFAGDTAGNYRALAGSGSVTFAGTDTIVVPAASASTPPDQNGGKLQIFTGSAAQSPMAELSAGAIPTIIAGTLDGSPPVQSGGDNIRGIFKFLRG
jgi:hypothetical protein